MLIVALLAIAPAAHALDPRVPLAELAVETWDRKTGLPSDAVEALARTADGILWIGTDLGLVAFDGASFERFDRATTPELPSSAIEKLAAEGDRLWIGTPRGLASYRAGVFERADLAGIPSVDVRSILVGRSGGLSVSTRAGLYLRRDGRFELATGSSGVSCRDMVEQPPGTLVGACGHLVVFEAGKPPTDSAFKDGTQAITVAPDGALWLGLNNGGVVRLDGAKGEPIVSHDGPVMALFVDREGALWVGGAGPTIQRRAPDGHVEELTLPGGAVPAGGKAFSEAPDGSMMIATSNLGLIHLREGRFRTVDDRSGAPRDVLSLYEDHAGSVWIASSSDPALATFGAGPKRHVPLSAPALTHLETPDGSHYVGTPAGLVRLDGDQAVAVPLENDALVTALARTGDGALWVGSNTVGLRRRSGDVVTRLDRADGNRIPTTALLVSRDGKTLWVGTTRDVCRIDGVDVGPGQPPRCFGPEAGVAGLVVALYEDATGGLWVGTYEHGLIRLRDGRGVALSGEQGLFQDTEYAIFEDASARLWMSGPRGVVRASLAELDALADGRITQVTARLFGRADGLPTDETNGGNMSAFRAHSGRMWFATPGGAVWVDPDAPDAPTLSPSSTVTELRVGARKLPNDGGPVASDERELLVRYTAPTFDRASELRFRYRLDGVDEDWVDAGQRRIAMYTDVPPGSHVFHVAARAAGASAWGDEARFALDVEARFSETWPFKVLVVLVAAALLYLVYRLRVAGLVAREARLAKLVSQRTSELAQAKTELEDLNGHLAERVEETVAALRSSERMAAYGHTVAGVAHEVRQPLFAIGTAAYVLSNKLRGRDDLERDVKLLARETRRMNRVMDELLEFAKPRVLELAKTSVAALVHDTVQVFRDEHDADGKVPITVECQAGLPEVALDAERMSQVLVNLIANAKKHAAGMTRVEVRAFAEGPSVVLEVEDDGAGIPPADLPHIFDPFVTTGGTGLGLAIARRIVEEHHGAIAVRSSERGTAFRITLPLSEVAHG
ncbi:MAG: ATP-binding protein [Myxococcota bacterium]